jgi:hypothetical protein
MYSIVIVTYKNDFDKLQTCLQSLYSHLTSPDVPVIVVLNDDEEHLTTLLSIVNPYQNIKVVHCSVLGAWTRSLDWWSQQYFKLAVSDVIHTPWYLIVDSDDVFIDTVDNRLFDQGRARCLTEPILRIKDSSNPSLLLWLNQSYKIVNYDKNDESLKELADILFTRLPGNNMREFVNYIIARYNKAGWTNEEIRHIFKLN